MIIRSKLITEKSARLETTLIYTFEVDPNASKTQIAQAITDLYGKKPLSVRTVVRPGKQRRVGRTRATKTSATRKIAYVQMKDALGTITHAK